MNLSASIFGFFLAVASFVASENDGAEGRIRVANRPPTATSNSHYPGGRAPLRPLALIKLPAGAISPEGWLRKELELQALGFHGHLAEISSFLRRDNNAWLSATGQGERGWEEVPYWLKGFGDCAYLLGNQPQIKEARFWIEAVIRGQREDGFFGPRGAKSTVESTSGKFDLWPNMVMLCCLQSYYEHTPDRRVLDLMTKYFHWELTVPEADFLPPYWQHQRAGDNLWSVLWLYDRTGDARLLELADKIYRHTANWTDGIPDWHNVNMAQAFGGPTFYYRRSPSPRYLRAAERNYQTIRASFGQTPGGMFAGDEVCRKGFTDPRQAIETCGMVEMMFSDERLLSVTGDLAWADRCEDVAFNSLPAALTADLKALRYLTSPNLILSDKQSKAPGLGNGGDMLEMNPHIHRCCQHNFGHGWPFFAEHLWMATQDNGLAAVLYAPSKVTATVGDGTRVVIEAKTHYPFEEKIEMVVTPTKPTHFPLYLRVPAWCDDAAVMLNNKMLQTRAKPGHYVVLDRNWSAGDRVELALSMKVALHTWTKNHNSVSVERGPLTYSLKIGEKYDRSGGTSEWPAWEIRPTTPWNYGLILNPSDGAGSFAVVKKDWPKSDEPFAQENVPIELTARGKRIPKWKSDSLGLVGLLQDSPAWSNEPAEAISLIPMGAARLRISSFPVIGEGEAAHRWVIPP